MAHVLKHEPNWLRVHHKYDGTTAIRVTRIHLLGLGYHMIGQQDGMTVADPPFDQSMPDITEFPGGFLDCRLLGMFLGDCIINILRARGVDLGEGLINFEWDLDADSVRFSGERWPTPKAAKPKADQDSRITKFKRKP